MIGCTLTREHLRFPPEIEYQAFVYMPICQNVVDELVFCFKIFLYLTDHNSERLEYNYEAM